MTDIIAVVVWSGLAVAIYGVYLVSRPRGGYIKYFRECPLWHEPEDKG